MTENDCRQVLGLSENYTEDQLKNQYRKLVLKYHPDRQKGDNTKFIIIQKAYEILLKSKENPAYAFRQKPNSPSKTDIYQERRQAEEAYKSKVKQYYVKRKRARSESKQFADSFLRNIRYFFLFVAIVVIFWITMAICIAIAGGLGAILFLIITGVIISKIDWNRFE